MKGKLQDTIVVKFGGSVLEGDGDLARAAALINGKLREGVGVVAVVSAMKGTTDDLLNLSKKVSPSMDPALVDEILSLGEKTSARLLCAALASRGVRAVPIDPDSSSWPVITDDSHMDANPDIELTRERVLKHISPMLGEGRVPVVCGFLGKTVGGKVTTLGRGGSDTTAVLLGGCLGAKEVLLIKDVDGVFSSDPDKVSNPRFIENLTGAEAGLLASGGAKFLHAKALRYLSRGIKIRVTSLDRFESGTVIVDDLPEVRVEVSSTRVSMITVVGVDPNRAGSTASIARSIRRAGGRIVSMSLEERAAIFYVAGGNNVLPRLHRTLVGRKVAKAVSIFDRLAMVTVKGRALETEPGIVQRVTQPLARNKINLYGVITILSSVRVFVPLEQSNKALALIRYALGVADQAGSAVGKGRTEGGLK